MKENWKEIVNYEGLYEVSDMGRIKSMCRWCWNGHGRFLRKEKIKKVHKKDYYRVQLSSHNVRKLFLVHRLVAQAFIGDCPEEEEVNHKNGVKTDNRIENLEYVTKSENSKHAVALGLIDHAGEKCPVSKLTNSQVLGIRRRHKKGDTSYKKLGMMFGVSKSTIAHIITRRNWGHLST